jgi:hypothetical protein
MAVLAKWNWVGIRIHYSQLNECLSKILARVYHISFFLSLAALKHSTILALYYSGLRFRQDTLGNLEVSTAGHALHIGSTVVPLLPCVFFLLGGHLSLDFR